MHQRHFLGGGWSRGPSGNTAPGTGVVRRAHPASGAQWNVQVVRGKVNGKCLWNACKALSLGLLLMVLGAAMATIGYYADQLSVAQEVRGNHTVRVKNESRGFHLNNLSYAGPIVMGVGGFIVVAACVMTFEARDSAAKVVPARFKVSGTGAHLPAGHLPCAHVPQLGGLAGHGSLRAAGSQTGAPQAPHAASRPQPPDRRTLTQSFMQFSRGLALPDTQYRHMHTLNVQGSFSKSPSAPDLSLERSSSVDKTSPTSTHRCVQEKPKQRQTLASCALLNPRLLHRHALSVDETAANYRMSHESLQGSGSQGSMAMDLHLDCPVTLRVRDKRRNQLRRQRRVDEDERQPNDESRRNSHSCSPRLPSHHHRDFSISHSSAGGGSAHQLPTHSAHPYQYSSNRRSSNASDCTHRSRKKRKDCPHSRGRLERAISSDSRLTGAIPKCHHHHYYHHHHHNRTSPTQTSTEQEPPGCSSDSDVKAKPQQEMC